MSKLGTRARAIVADVDRILAGAVEAEELRAGMRARMNDLADDARQIEGDARRLAKESAPEDREPLIDVADRAAQIAALASAPTDEARAAWLVAVPA
jgi:hypothetical protein